MHYPNLFYFGMQDHWYTFHMFNSQQAWYVHDITMGKLSTLSRKKMLAHVEIRVTAEDVLEDDYAAIQVPGRLCARTYCRNGLPQL